MIKRRDVCRERQDNSSVPPTANSMLCAIPSTSSSRLRTSALGQLRTANAIGASRTTVAIRSYLHVEALPGASVNPILSTFSIPVTAPSAARDKIASDSLLRWREVVSAVAANEGQRVVLQQAFRKLLVSIRCELLALEQKTTSASSNYLFSVAFDR